MKTYLRFLRRHWKFLGFALLLPFCGSFGQTFYFGLFNDRIRESYSLSHSDYGTLYALATLLSAFVMMRIGKMVDIANVRVLTLFVFIGMMLGCVGLSYHGSLGLLVFSIFLLRFCGQSMFNHISTTAVARSFRQERGRALSIAFLGNALGQVLLPGLVVLSFAYMDWTAAWLGAALLLLLLMFPTLWWLLEDKNIHPPAPTLAEERHELAERHWTQREVLTDWRYYAMLLTSLAPGFILTAFFFHQSVLLSEKSWPLGLFAQGLILYAIATVVANIVAGILVDKFGARLLWFFVILPMGICLSIIPFFHDPIVMHIAMCGAGLTVGINSVVGNAVLAEMYGVRHLGAIRSFSVSITVIGTAIAPPIFGILIDGGIPLATISFICGMYSLAVSAGNLWLTPRLRAR